MIYNFGKEMSYKILMKYKNSWNISMFLGEKTSWARIILLYGFEKKETCNISKFCGKIPIISQYLGGNVLC